MSPIRAAVPTDFKMGLGWQLYPASTGMGVNWAFKNGGAFGFSSDTALAPDQGLAVTVMWNQGRPADQHIELAYILLRMVIVEHTPATPSTPANHHTPTKHDMSANQRKLSDSGANAADVLAPAVAGAVLISAGAALMLIRRRHRRRVLSPR